MGGGGIAFIGQRWMRLSWCCPCLFVQLLLKWPQQVKQPGGSGRGQQRHSKGLNISSLYGLYLSLSLGSFCSCILWWFKRETYKKKKKNYNRTLAPSAYFRSVLITLGLYCPPPTSSVQLLFSFPLFWALRSRSVLAAQALARFRLTPLSSPERHAHIKKDYLNTRGRCCKYIRCIYIRVPQGFLFGRHQLLE